MLLTPHCTSLIRFETLFALLVSSHSTSLFNTRLSEIKKIPRFKRSIQHSDSQNPSLHSSCTLINQRSIWYPSSRAFFSEPRCCCWMYSVCLLYSMWEGSRLFFDLRPSHPLQPDLPWGGVWSRFMPERIYFIPLAIISVALQSSVFLCSLCMPSYSLQPIPPRWSRCFRIEIRMLENIHHCYPTIAIILLVFWARIFVSWPYLSFQLPLRNDALHSNHSPARLPLSPHSILARTQLPVHDSIDYTHRDPASVWLVNLWTSLHLTDPKLTICRLFVCFFKGFIHFKLR